MQTLIVSVALLGLAVAFSSPTSVLAVLVLLDLPSGLRRSVAFIGGWVGAITLIGAVLVLFPAVDFHKTSTAPSRAASIAELVIGAALVIAAVALHRRPPAERPSEPIPRWLVRLVGRHWAVALAAGVVMLTYSITIVAALEVLKAHVGRLDRIVALLVFALASIVTITAPVMFAIVAPERATGELTRFKEWLTAHSRTLSVALLALIGIAIVLKAAYDLSS